ncbi:unnamed protein product [Acanthoscelides obtectus]|uniref:Uncharacterized protein n=1 Tax=Acanthoscelides obtectus TaxID=200917 RepID=A0A9P0LVM1_ACAOB|nr:unnamed protein product [Acanthoscelides obtectus]CAK1672549.1 hypothetical protein AOBTE_LOCUS28959 [Acanthoscelides obtectus]
MQCAALLVLSALALGSAVPIGSVYDYGYAPYHKDYASDYVKDAIYGHGAYGHPYYGKHFAGVHDIDDVYHHAVHAWPVHDVASHVGDDLHKKLYVKERQWEDDKHLDEQHRIQHIHLKQEQELLHEQQHQQHMQLEHQKAALDHLHHVQEQEIHDQMERLDDQQFAQKVQLDELHAVEDAKVAAHSAHPAFLRDYEHPYSYGHGYAALHSYGHPYAAMHSYGHPYAAMHRYEHPYAGLHSYGRPYAALYGYGHPYTTAARWGPYAATNTVHPWAIHHECPECHHYLY